MSWSALGPTLAGFQDFVTNVMQIPVAALPVGAPIISVTFSLAQAQVNLQLPDPPYTLAVYNLAGSLLLNMAQDQPGQTYFAGLAAKFGLLTFTPGVVGSAADGSTSDSLIAPKIMETLTLADLQRLKDPYGRQYLAFAQSAGSLWGMT